MRDVIALENVEPKKKKGTLAKTAGRGGWVRPGELQGENFTNLKF